MPFDSLPQETKTDPLSLEALVAWLERQPAASAYDWPDPAGCLICRFLQDSGAPRDGFVVPTWLWQNHRQSYHSLFPSLQVYHYVGGTLPWTFGAALSRARSILSQLAREAHINICIHRRLRGATNAV